MRTHKCPACSKTIPRHLRKCSYCGAETRPAKAPSAEVVAGLKASPPPQVIMPPNPVLPPIGCLAFFPVLLTLLSLCILGPDLVRGQLGVFSILQAIWPMVLGVILAMGAMIGLNLLTYVQERNRRRGLSGSNASRKASVRFQPIGVALLFGTLIMASALTLVLLAAGVHKVSGNGVTTLSYRWDDIYLGLGLGGTAFAIFWLLAGQTLAYPAKQSPEERRLAGKSGAIVFQLCGVPVVLLSFILASDFSWRLDENRLSARSLFGTRTVDFETLQQVVLREEHWRDKKGEHVSIVVNYNLKTGHVVEWPADSFFKLEKELREILQRRQIPIVDQAPSRSRVYQQEATPVPSAAEQTAALEEYHRKAILPAINTRHEALRGSRWTLGGEESVTETKLEFSTNNSITIDRIWHTPFNRKEVVYRATFVRTVERYEFTFEDGSVMQADITIHEPDYLSVHAKEATGGTAAKAAQFFGAALQRVPPVAGKAAE